MARRNVCSLLIAVVFAVLPAAGLFAQPLHPYTQGLMDSMPALGNMPERLATIPGVVPRVVDRAPGCRFASRCQARLAHKLTICEEREPDLIPMASGQAVRCWLYQDDDSAQSNHRAPIRLHSNGLESQVERPLGARPAVSDG